MEQGDGVAVGQFFAHEFPKLGGFGFAGGTQVGQLFQSGGGVVAFHPLGGAAGKSIRRNISLFF